MSPQASAIAVLFENLPCDEQERLLRKLISNQKNKASALVLPKISRKQQILELAIAINEETPSGE